MTHKNQWNLILLLLSSSQKLFTFFPHLRIKRRKKRIDIWHFHIFICKDWWSEERRRSERLSDDVKWARRQNSYRQRHVKKGLEKRSILWIEEGDEWEWRLNGSDSGWWMGFPWLGIVDLDMDKDRHIERGWKWEWTLWWIPNVFWGWWESWKAGQGLEQPVNGLTLSFIQSRVGFKWRTNPVTLSTLLTPTSLPNYVLL